jgi:quercetin dioxygenase-like cupin family protein
MFVVCVERTENPMPRRRNLAVTMALGIVVTAAGTGTDAPGQADRDSAAPRRRNVVAESRFVVTNAAAQADLVQLVVDFEPGAWTSLHTHGGQAINLVLEGEITLRHGGMDHPYKAGQSWTDSTSQVHAAGNTGSGKARLLTNFLLPKGAPQITVVQESQFGPAVTYEATFSLPRLPADAEIVQQVIDLPRGWRTQRASNGFTANVVVDGELSYQIGAEQKSYKRGDSWMAQAGTTITEQNDTAGPARIFSSSIVARGATP